MWDKLVVRHKADYSVYLSRKFKPQVLSEVALKFVEFVLK
jgi:hypothetical protein